MVKIRSFQIKSRDLKNIQKTVQNLNEKLNLRLKVQDSFLSNKDYKIVYKNIGLSVKQKNRFRKLSKAALEHTIYMEMWLNGPKDILGDIIKPGFILFITDETRD